MARIDIEPRPVWLTPFALAGTLWLMAAGCVQPVALEGRPCPCAAGFECCESAGVCLRPDELCPAGDAGRSDGAGAAWESADAGGGFAQTADADGVPGQDAAQAVDALVCPSFGPPAFCEALPRLAAPPVIDGVPECGLTTVPITPMVWTGSGPAPDERTASYTAAWTDQGVYLYVRVFVADRMPSPTPTVFHCGDAVEMFLDSDAQFVSPPRYDEFGSRQFVFPAPERGQASTNKSWVWESGVSRTSYRGAFATIATDDGYAVEALFNASDLNLNDWTLRQGSRVAFDVAIDLYGPSDSGGCTRRGQFALRGSPTPLYSELNSGDCVLPWCNVLAFCQPMLTLDGVPPTFDPRDASVGEVPADRPNDPGPGNAQGPADAGPLDAPGAIDGAVAPPDGAVDDGTVDAGTPGP